LRLWKQRTLPLVIGGDHSITYPLIEQLQQQMDIVVLWFDAHTDESFLRSGQSHHYGNVVTRILELPHVQRVIQIGTRGFTDARRAFSDTDRLGTISAARLRSQGPTALLDAIPRGLACYISLDLDVLDPSVAPAVGTPVAGGLLLHELEAAVEAVGLMHRVEGVDLVELNPDRAPGSATASAACRLLLKGLDSMMYRRLIPSASVGTLPIAAWQRT
jgi:agmatinase